MDNSRRRPGQAEALPARPHAPPAPPGMRPRAKTGRPRRQGGPPLLVMAALMLMPTAPADANNFAYVDALQPAVVTHVAAGVRG